MFSFNKTSADTDIATFDFVFKRDEFQREDWYKVTLISSFALKFNAGEYCWTKKKNQLRFSDGREKNDTFTINIRCSYHNVLASLVYRTWLFRLDNFCLRLRDEELLLFTIICVWNSALNSYHYLPLWNVVITTATRIRKIERM